MSFLEQALTVTHDPAEQLDLLRQAGADARIAGRLEQAEELMRRALDLARQLGDREQILLATTALTSVLIAEFRNDEAMAMIEPAMTEFADADEGSMAELQLNLARAHYLNADFRTSLEILETVLETAERRGLVRLIALAWLHKGNALYSLGRRREAIGLAEAVKGLATEHDLTEIHLRIMGNLANAATETDMRTSLDSWREALALARKFGQRGLLINGVGNFGYTAFLAGEWDDALVEMDAFLAEELAAKDRLIMLNNALIVRGSRGEPTEDGLAEMARLGADMSGKWHIFVADPEANAAMASGDLAKARDSFMEIAEVDPGSGTEYVYRAGRMALWARDVEDAAHLSARLEESGAYGPVADARVATLQAGLAALGGRPAEALALYRDALRGWRDTHAIWDEALTGIDMATLLDPAEPEVAAVVASTRAILERLRAQPYLDRLDAAVARQSPRAKPAARAAARAEVAVTE